MPPPFQAISDLQPGLNRIALQLRLVHRYILPSFQNDGEIFSSECIFHDRSGDRIHASIPKGLISKFEMLMEEGKIYAIKNFVVANNFMRYKTTNSKYKLQIYKQTEMFEIFVENFPRVMFNFKPFEEIHSIDNIQSAELFDVIGVIVSTNIPQAKEVNGKSTKLMDFKIDDLEKKTLSCTLWDKYADQLYNFLIKNPEDPIIVILQYCRPTAYKAEIKVTNAYHATKVIFDDSFTEIKEFKEEFEKGGKKTTTSITDLTLVDATKSSNSNKDVGTEFKTISHLQTDGKVGFFWVYASIFEINTIGGWGYLACKICFKKLAPDNTNFFCKKCNSFEVGGKMRYSLAVKVADDYGSTAFHLWDRECIELIGKYADTLNTAGELDELPIEIESLVGKKSLFMVNVKDGETKDFKGAYSIMKVTCDPKMIKKYCELYADNQGTEPISEMNDIENPTVEIGSSKESVKTSLTDLHKKKIHFVDVNDDESSTSTKDSHMKTEDCVGLNDDDTLNNALTNVCNKKCRKVIKKEKE